jgi:hypothetical protein
MASASAAALQQQQQQQTMTTINPLHSIKEKIVKIRKRCKVYEVQLKKLNKFIKSKKLDSSSRHVRNKKKLEKKYLIYKTRLTGLMSRQSMLINKNPSLNDDEDDEAGDVELTASKSTRRSRQHRVEASTSRKKGSSSVEKKHRRHRDRDSEPREAKISRTRASSIGKQQQLQQQHQQLPQQLQPQQTAQNNQPNFKLPYPVLNDKRDMVQILTILKVKSLFYKELCYGVLWLKILLVGVSPQTLNVIL